MRAASRWRWAAIVLAAWPALAQQQPAPTAADPGTAAVEGTVLDAATGEPIRKADVTLNGGQGAAGAANLRAGSDVSGHFAFRGLQAGVYWVNAQHSGYGAQAGVRSQIGLQPGEQKSGIEIRLPQQGSISGRVVDEFEHPVLNCTVSALQPQPVGRRGGYWGHGGAATNDQGEYWIQGLEKGRYLLSARCGGELEAPHPLMAVNDPRKPHLVYAPQYYPGVADAKGATAVRVTPGVETQGIDFQVRRTTGVTLRGRIDAVDPSALSGANVQIRLAPPNLDAADGMQLAAGMDQSTREFQIRSVTPGSYVLSVATFGSGPTYLAMLPVEIGATTPDPIHVVLAPAPTMSGRLEVEGDDPPALDSVQVTLDPLAASIIVQQPQAQVSKDGTFTLPRITPGRWRLNLGGVSYVKSLTIGDRDVSPYGFDLAPGAPGAMRILASNRMGQVQASVSAASAGGGQVIFVVVPADPDRAETGMMRLGVAARGGQATIPNIVPGRYRLFAFDSADPSSVLQRPEVLKALESRAQVVEVGEGETVQASADLIEAREIEEASQETQ